MYPIVIEHDLINLGKLAKQQKSQKATEIKKTILKPTHDKKWGKTWHH